VVPPFRGVPVVDDHLHRHLAAPDARRAPRGVRSRGQPPMPPLPMDLERGRNAEEGR
jgi:hypothetical protein